MNKAKIYPWAGAIIGVTIGYAVSLMLGNREGFLFNQTLLNFVIIGACVGASIGAIADMLGKGDRFTDRFSGIIGILVYGAAIGAIVDTKFSQPIPRAIAGAIVSAIAFLLYYKFVVCYIANKNREVDAVTYAIFGIIIGTIYGAAIVIINTIYSAIYFGNVIKANGYSISGYVVNEIYSNVSIGIIIGGLLGVIFSLFFGAVHSVIRGKGAVGGAIVGSIVLGEVFQSFSGVILGLLAGAIFVAIGSKGNMRSMVAGGTVGATIGAFLSAVGEFATIFLSINIIFFIPTFLIIGYHAGMIFANENEY